MKKIRKLHESENSKKFDFEVLESDINSSDGTLEIYIGGLPEEFLVNGESLENIPCAKINLDYTCEFDRDSGCTYHDPYYEEPASCWLEDFDVHSIDITFEQEVDEIPDEDFMEQNNLTPEGFKNLKKQIEDFAEEYTYSFIKERAWDFAE